jgi:beta-hydroxylase
MKNFLNIKSNISHALKISHKGWDNNKYAIMFKIVIIIIFIFVLIEIIPYLITILFPNLCYGCTDIGKFQQYLNKKINLGYISWFSYILMFLYFIYISSFIKNNILKYILIFICFYMIYLPTLPLLNIITLILCLVNKNPPFINNYHNIFPSSIEIEKQSNIIINEFKKYYKKNKPECIRKSNPGFKIETNSNKENCWRSLYLKKIGKIDNNMIQYFPNTIKLLKDDQIHNAFFSILDPGVEIPEHIGYYKGYLRYHMGVIIPNNNSKIQNNKAYIVCGGEKYFWKENKGVVFDDMYLHYVKNPSNHVRVVLYIDFKRKNESFIINKLNNYGIYLIENSILFNSFLKNQHNQKKIGKNN